MSICWKPAWCECPECGPLEPADSDRPDEGVGGEDA